MGKIGQIDTTSRKFFQHVSHHLMSKIKLFGNLFWIFFWNYFARVSTALRSLQRIMPAPPPVSGSRLPAALLCKKRGKVETLFEVFCCREAHGEYLPYILLCKNPSKVTSAIFFAVDVTMLDRIKMAPRQFHRRAWKRKMSLGHRPNSPQII